jgi:hypothetical protein
MNPRNTHFFRFAEDHSGVSKLPREKIFSLDQFYLKVYCKFLGWFFYSCLSNTLMLLNGCLCFLVAYRGEMPRTAPPTIEMMRVRLESPPTNPEQTMAWVGTPSADAIIHRLPIAARDRFPVTHALPGVAALGTPPVAETSSDSSPPSSSR